MQLKNALLNASPKEIEREISSWRGSIPIIPIWRKTMINSTKYSHVAYPEAVQIRHDCYHSRNTTAVESHLHNGEGADSLTPSWSLEREAGLRPATAE